MKKCSHSDHEALAQLNITPLLDLAFVLLVIFIITTTPIVNDLDVDLPSAANRPKDPKPKIHYVTIESDGNMFLDKYPVDLAGLHEKVLAMRVDDPDLNVAIRGSARTKYRYVVGVMDMLQQVNVGKVNLATEPFSEASAKRKE
jgi:biopolymer transport protein ExbD